MSVGEGDVILSAPQSAARDLEAVLVEPDDTLRQAMAQMRADDRGMVVVVGHDGRVLGVVTDSDVRRAALNGKSLEAPIAEVMAAQPLAASASASDQEILELLHAHRLRSLPVVSDGLLVGVRSLEGPLESDAGPVAVIMAGGRGQRLRPFTDRVPKPLLKVGSMSIVERIIRGLATAGVRRVFLAVNYKAEVFEQRLGFGERMGVQLTYLREETEMGTAGALSLLPRGHQGPILVTNGDIVTTVDFARLCDFHWRHGAAITVAGVEHLSPIPYGVLRTAEHHLLSIEEKPERRDLCSAGIYVLDPVVLPLVPEMAPLDMPELIARVLAEGLPVNVFPILEKWFDIGGTAEFERVLVEFAVGEDD